MTYKTNDVFGISRDVPLNYVSRKGVDEEFIDNLTRDKHVVVYGSSKQGKTNLRKHCLQESDYITVTCSNRWSMGQLHAAILKAAGYEITESSSRTFTGQAKLSASFKFLGTGVGVDGGGEKSSSVVTTPLELDPSDVNDVIHALQQIDFQEYIVLEDFHYLPVDTQKDFAVSLKAFHENSDFCFIVVGVWLDENRLTVYNGDLSGRVVAVDADRWTIKELRQVISSGADLLNIAFDTEFVEELVEGCQGSVSIVQEVCNRVCRLYDVFETQDGKRTVVPSIGTGALVKLVVDAHGGRYESFLVKFAEGFTRTALEMYKWLLYPVLTATPEDLREGLRLPDIREALDANHPGSPLNAGNITQALQSAANLQVTKELKPIILDYDETSRRLSVVDRGFIIWLMHQDRDELLESVGLPRERPSDLLQPT